MSTICGLRSGSLIELSEEDYNGPLTLTVDGNELEIGPVISLRASENILVQIQNTFGNGLIITPFGDRPGSLEVTVLNGRDCDNEEDADLKAVKEYRGSRFDGGDPLDIEIGDDFDMKGILYGMSFGITGDNPLPTIVLTFTVWPDDGGSSGRIGTRIA